MKIAREELMAFEDSILPRHQNESVPDAKPFDANPHFLDLILLSDSSRVPASTGDRKIKKKTAAATAKPNGKPPASSPIQGSQSEKEQGILTLWIKTTETVKPISLGAPKPAMEIDNPDGSSGSGDAAEEMVVPHVDKSIFEELEAMGFPKSRAT
ncbi:unnamed protein product [Eruca vesicaria subsp. sativa]|uniref:Uncharacterized protein n=1 Tax=Eruca vesicaria subsp. sativa TaxID=29727 RepID=A0ABC8JZC9_ERUVS|nr:unnamed protein product [Eruca vesicaria subsp. sativa]